MTALTCLACGTALPRAGALRTGEPATSPGTAGDAPEPSAVSSRRELILDYSAPAECPTRESYAWQVESRTTTLSFGPESPAAQSTRLSVELNEARGQWIGSVSIAGDERLERRVRGDRCEDVVAALALITVLRLEPSARENLDARVAGTEPNAGPGAAGDPGSVQAVTNEAVAEEASARAQDSHASAQGQADSARNAGDAPEQRAGVPRAEAASGGNLAAVIPEPALAAPEDSLPGSLPEPPAQEARTVDEAETMEAFASIRPGTPLRGDVAAYVGYASVPSDAVALALQFQVSLGPTDASWAASIGVSYGRGAEPASSGSAVFNLYTAQLGLCAPGLRTRAEGIWISPCAHLRGGVLNVSVAPGELTISAPGALRPWLALGPSLQAGVPISGGWALRAVGALSFQLVRDQFEVERIAGEPPSSTFYQPEPLSIELAFGLGYAF